MMGIVGKIAGALGRIEEADWSAWRSWGRRVWRNRVLSRLLPFLNRRVSGCSVGWAAARLNLRRTGRLPGGR